MTANQIWAAICLVMGGSFLIMSIVFALLKEKGAVLMAGFNSFSKEKREQYDSKRISGDMRNSLFIWSAVLFIGGLLSFFISFYFGIAAGIAWIILCFKNFSTDADKAFKRYKL